MYENIYRGINVKHHEYCSTQFADTFWSLYQTDPQQSAAPSVQTTLKPHYNADSGVSEINCYNS